MSLSGGRPFWMSGSCREAFPNVREWSGGPPGYLAVVGRPSRMSGSGQKTLPDGPEWWEALLDVRQLSRDPSVST